MSIAHEISAHQDHQDWRDEAYFHPLQKTDWECGRQGKPKEIGINGHTSGSCHGRFTPWIVCGLVAVCSLGRVAMERRGLWSFIAPSCACLTQTTCGDILHHSLPLSSLIMSLFHAMLTSSDVGISLYPADDEDDEDDEELNNTIISNMCNSRATMVRLSPQPGFQLVVVDRPSDSTMALAGSTRPKPKQLKMVPLADKVPFMLQVAGHSHASLTYTLHCSMPLDPLRIWCQPGKPDQSHNRSYSHPSTGHASLTYALHCSMPLDPLWIRRWPGKPDRSHNALVIEMRL